MSLEAHLVVAAWINKPEKRMQALMACFDDNLNNRNIASVSLVIQDPVDVFTRAVSESKDQGIRWLADRLVHTKVRRVQLGRQPTFRDLFGIGSKVKAGTPVIVTSSDLAFDDSLESLEEVDLKDTLICLSPDGGKGNFPPHVSQGAWIYSAPLLPFDCDWAPGQLGSDNKLAHQAWFSGLTVVNPCFDIMAKQSRWHEPDWPIEPRLEGPYLDVHPVGLPSLRRRFNG